MGSTTIKTFTMDTIEEKDDLQVFQLLMETGELESKQRIEAGELKVKSRLLHTNGRLEKVTIGP